MSKTLHVKKPWGKREVDQVGTRETVAFTWRFAGMSKVPSSITQMEKLWFDINIDLEPDYATTWRFGFQPSCTMFGTNGPFFKNRALAEPYVGLLKCSENKPVGVTISIIVPSRGNGSFYELGPYRTVKLDEFVHFPDSWTYYFNQRKKTFLETKTDFKVTIKIEVEFGAQTSMPRLGVHATRMKVFEDLSLQRLSANFAQFRTSEEFQDVTIVCAAGKMVRANKFILLARCPYLKSLLTSGIQDGTTAEVLNLPDVRFDVMEILIGFWTTGKLAPKWKDAEIIENFTYSAWKFGVDDILDLLDDTLGDEDICPANVRLLKLVKKLGLKNAVKRIVNNIAAKSAAIESTEEFLRILET